MNEDRIECDHCKGCGRLRVIFTKDLKMKIVDTKLNSNNDKNLTIMCSKCFGTGELNWLEVIFGKKVF